MGMGCHFANIFKLSGLINFLKAFSLNFLFSWKTSMLKTLALYVLLNMFKYLMIFPRSLKWNFCCDERNF